MPAPARLDPTTHAHRLLLLMREYLLLGGQETVGIAGPWPARRAEPERRLG